MDRDVTAAVATGPGAAGAAAAAAGAGVLGGKWFKFDDEQVSHVDRRQAVQGSFGSGGRMHQYASAYMLVYIREAEAARLMATVKIPAALTSRLDVEYQRHAEVRLGRVVYTYLSFVSKLMRGDT